MSVSADASAHDMRAGISGRSSEASVPSHVRHQDDHCRYLDRESQRATNVLGDVDEFIRDPQEKQSEDEYRRAEQEAGDDGDALRVALRLVLHSPIIHCAPDLA